MQAISRIRSSSRTHNGPDRRRPCVAAEAEAGESRPPVPVRPRAQGGGRTHHLPSAAFLAQLIATRSQAPQTRMRRRGEPAEAVTAYGHRWGEPDPGATLSREM